MITLSDKYATYLQIVDMVKDKILQEEYCEDEKVPSVREVSEMLQVNPNTVARAFERLQLDDTIYSKRGIGYFVQKNARAQILVERKERFIKQILPEVFRQMDLLSIGVDQIQELFDEYNKRNNKNF